jgi:hypothetical protein
MQAWANTLDAVREGKPLPRIDVGNIEGFASALLDFSSSILLSPRNLPLSAEQLSVHHEKRAAR